MNILLKKRRKNQRANRLLKNSVGLVLGCFLLAACGGKNDLSDLARYIAELKAQPEKKQEADKSKQVPLVAPVKYGSKEEASPFQKKVQTPSSSGGAGDLSTRTPLQMFPADVLQYIGLISQGKNVWAIIAAPNKKIYQVTIGDKIGEKGGQVTLIENDRVEVTEQVQGEPGEAPVPRVTILRLVDASKGQ